MPTTFPKNILPSFVLTGAFVLALSCCISNAEIFTVTRTNNTGPGSLPVVLTAANSTQGSHTIEFSVAGTIGLVFPLPVITNNLTINGRGSVTISGGDVTPIFGFAQGTTNILSGLMLTRGSGAITNMGTLVVSDCILTNNQSEQGGCLFSPGTLTIIGSTIVSNRAWSGEGGAVYSAGLLTISSSVFQGNMAQGSGGAVATHGTANITDSTFTNNTATNFYGFDNYSSNGGGIYSSSALYISNSIVHECIAGNGGAIYCVGPFIGNLLTISSSKALLGFGGGLFTGNTVTMERVVMLGNQAQGQAGFRGGGGGGGGAGLGGGWFHTNGTAVVTNCTLSGNSAIGGEGGAGGAIDTGGNGGGNNAGQGTQNAGVNGGFGGGGSGAGMNGGSGGPPGFGGGAGGARDTTSKQGYHGRGHGGGVFIANASVAFVNCTIVSNSVSSATFPTNGVANGAGVYSYKTSGTRVTTLINTIVGNNTALTSSPDVFGTNFSSAGFNLIGNSQGALGLSLNDYQNEPPNVGPLQNNGGGTLTHALLSGSLAIGGGTSLGAPATDQRGVVRPSGQVDIGAFQLITKVIPQIAWPTPIDISYGTPLSPTELSANAGVAGTYTYTPPTGTILNAGSNQPLGVLFTPADPITYLPNSNTVRINVRKADQAITFGPLVNKQLSDAPFNLSATASSGLPVSFSLASGPASVVGTAVVLGASPGLITIRATQAGNTNYNAAPDVEQSFYLGTAPYPVFSQQPLTQTVNAGERVVFSVVAIGAPLTYQWQFKGTNLPGETTTSLTLQRVNSGHTGPYNVLVSNPYGTVASLIATLTVNVNAGAPVITSQPLSQTVTAGSAATLSVSATGSGLTYQWYQGANGNTNALILSATGPSYTTPALIASTSYWVAVRNGSGVADSGTAILTVQPVTAAAALNLNMLAGLTIDGTAGGSYRIEYTTNLTSPNWLAVTNLVLPSPRHYYADWDSTNAVRRFYRVVAP